MKFIKKILRKVIKLEGNIKCPGCGQTEKITFVVVSSINRKNNYLDKKYFKCENCKKQFEINEAGFE